MARGDASGTHRDTRDWVLGLDAVRITLLEKILWTEDFRPGAAPDVVLDPGAWETTDESITFGVKGTAMPPWDYLPEETRWDLVNYIRSL